MSILRIGSKLFKGISAALVGVLLASNSFSILNSQFSIDKPAYAADSYSVGFSADKAQAARGETVTYSLVFTNDGSTTLTNFNVYQATRPANTSYVNGSGVVTDNAGSTPIADAWFSDPAGTNLGSLTPQQTMTFRWQVRVDDNAPQGQTVTESVNFKTAELQVPRGATANFTVAVNPATSSLCAEKTVDKQTANVGDTLTFTIRVCNNGDIDQTGVLVYDRLPLELTYKTGTTSLSARGATLPINDSWIGNSNADGNGINLGTMKAGESFTITYQATLNSNAKDGQTIQNVAQVRSDQKPNFLQCVVTFTARVPAPPAVSPNCSLTKKIKLPNGEEKTSVGSSDHTFAPGEEIVYRLFVSNPGSGDASNFSMSDFLPPYVSWVSGEGGYAPNENKVNFDLGTLKAGESRTLTYRAKVRDSIPSNVTEQKNSVKVTSPSGFDSCKAESSLWVGKPGAILAAAALPQTGTVPPSVLATLGLVAGGLIVRMRKFRVNKYWGK